MTDRLQAMHSEWGRLGQSILRLFMHLQKIKCIAHKEDLIEELIILVNLWLLYIIGIETVPY